MDIAVSDIEGPPPLGSGGHPSELTKHQSSNKVNVQTSLKEVLSLFCWKLFLLLLCSVCLNVHFIPVANGVGNAIVLGRLVHAMRMDNEDGLQERY